MNPIAERNTRLFNTPLELSLRTLFILSRFHPRELSLESIIYLDYFAIHSGDIKQGPRSLHPKYPFRSSELVVKREILQKSITLLLSRELLEVKFTSKGIYYASTSIGVHFISHFESKYSKELDAVCHWLYEAFNNLTEEDMAQIVNVNMEKWGGEFSNESKFRG